MASVAILTDSTADLTPEQAASAGITVVPLYVRFGSDEYRAGVDLTTEQFWQKLLAAGAAFPTTAAPSPGDFTRAFNDAFECGRRGDRLPHDRPEALRDLPERDPGRAGDAGARDPRDRHRLDVDVHGHPRAHRGGDGSCRRVGEGDRGRDHPAPAGRGPVRGRGWSRVPAQGRPPLGDAGRGGDDAVREADHHRDGRPGRDGRQGAQPRQGPGHRDREHRQGARSSASRSCTRPRARPRRSRTSARSSSRPSPVAWTRPRSPWGSSARPRAPTWART